MPGVEALPCPLPAPVTLQADEKWSAIDLISDLHLNETASVTFDAFAAHLRHTSADAVLILGDLFEYWVGDDSSERPFEAACIAVLAETAKRKFVAIMVGNRDFLLTPGLLARHGMHFLADPTLLQAWQHTLLLTHGDALCVDDVAYQQFRLWSRSELAQREFLTRPLHERLRLAVGFRHASELGRRQGPPPDDWIDVDAAAALACLRAAGAHRMVHGHTHRPGRTELAPGYERLVLSDWDCDQAPARAEVMRLTRAGLQRMAPATAATPC